MFSGRSAARKLGDNVIEGRFGVSVGTDPRAALVDATRANQIARRHLLQIQEQAAKAAAAGAQDPVAEAFTATEFRAKTIAATETWQAANAEMLRAAETVQTETGVLLLKEWNAESDSCDECADYDGEQVPVGASFSAGTDPGSVHPHCRCWVEITEASAARAA